MLMNKLKRVKEAPEKGYVLAYFRSEVVFRAYERLDTLLDEFASKESDRNGLLELHLFDDDKEYRCVMTGSKRYPDGVIEHIADFREESISVLCERAKLENSVDGKTVLNVLNHIYYDETTGMAATDDYRLKM